jgi:4-hydroxy-4-methyl-2-oxoglutarate aldolase
LRSESVSEMCARLRGYGSSTVGAVLDDLGLGGLITRIRPVAAGFRFAGPAFTVKLEVGELGSFRDTDFKIGDYIDQPPVGAVVAIDMAGAPVSALGGIATRVAQRRGLAAIVIDGGSRDLDETRALGFPLFVRHSLPVTGRCRVRLIATQIPIMLDGIDVAPDDILVGDDTGIVRIPKAHLSEVGERAAAIDARDRRVRELVEQGLGFSEAFRRAS